MSRDFTCLSTCHLLAVLGLSVSGTAQASEVRVSQTPTFTYIAKADEGVGLSTEVVSVIHDPVDLTIALLVRCGPREGFFTRHHAFLAQQKTIVDRVTPERLAGWTEPDISDRAIHIANDLALFQIEASLGVPPATAEVCLKDGVDIQHIKDMTDAAVKGGVEATPSFRLNGKLLNDVHVWAPLRSSLLDALPKASQTGGSPVELIEYVSYTCPHCARYEQEAADERSAMLGGTFPMLPVAPAVNKQVIHSVTAHRQQPKHKRVLRKKAPQAAVCTFPGRNKF